MLARCNRFTATSEHSSLLQVIDVSKEFQGYKGRKFVAVENANLQILRGETFGLVGQSGGGKTTLGLMIMGLVRPTSGEIRYRGQSITGVSEKALRPLRREIQMVSQNPLEALNPVKTVGQSIELPLINFRFSRLHRRKRVAEVLNLVGLKSADADRYPHELSGGQAQRICIARALVVEPRFVFLDEPVSSLDVSIQAQVLNLLMDLQEEFGLTYLFVAHDIGVVSFISDRIAVMQRGIILESGATRDVISNPQSNYTKALLSSVINVPKSTSLRGTGETLQDNRE